MQHAEAVDDISADDLGEAVFGLTSGIPDRDSRSPRHFKLRLAPTAGCFELPSMRAGGAGLLSLRSFQYSRTAKVVVVDRLDGGWRIEKLIERPPSAHAGEFEA